MGFIQSAANAAGSVVNLLGYINFYNDTDKRVYCGFYADVVHIEPGQTKRLELTAGSYFALKFVGDGDDKVFMYYNDMDESTVKAS